MMSRLYQRKLAEVSVGGARRDRTDDLKLAKLALSQLSYGPVVFQQQLFPTARVSHRRAFRLRDSRA